MLWLIKGLGPGGAEHLLVHHAGAADHSAFDLRTAYLVPAKNHLVADLEGSGVTVRCLNSPRGIDPRWLLRLRTFLRQAPVDIVHVHAPLVAAGARLVLQTLPHSTRPQLVSTEHNRWPRHRRLTRLANRLTFGLDDAHVAVSADVRDSMPERRRSDVHVIEHGVPLQIVRDAADRVAVRAELGLRDDEIVLCCVANLRREKGHADLLEAAASACRASPSLRVLVVGQGPLADEIAAQHRELRLGDRVLLLGYRPDAVRVLSGADALVMSSHHEGLPVAIMEARALGLPVLATAVGGIPSAVTDGVDGMLVPPHAPEQLAKAMCRFADDPSLRDLLRAGASEQAERFDIRSAVTEIESIYHSLL